jgi:hypothetical protein
MCIGLGLQANGTTQMKIHLIDGTYELFRSYYGPPPKKAPDGREVGATLGLLSSLLALLAQPDVCGVRVRSGYRVLPQ